jgi:hypothetical protein
MALPVRNVLARWIEVERGVGVDGLGQTSIRDVRNAL